MKEVNEQAKEYIHRFGDDNFSLQLIINCKKQINAQDVQLWGTVVDIRYFKGEWYDKIDDECYPVRMISIAESTTNIDTPFLLVEREKITRNIVSNVQKDYNQYYDNK